MMAQCNDVTFDESGRVLFVHNRICLKSDCQSTKLYKQKILFMSSEEERNLKKQILVPSFLFGQFETKASGEKLVSDDYSYKVSLCFQHLTRQTQNFYLKNKVLPDWAQIKQHAKKIGKVHSPYPKKGQNYFWSGHRYSRQALNQKNLFQLPETKSVETKDVASLDVRKAIETEHLVQDSSDNDDIQLTVPLPSTSVGLQKTWHADQLRSETESSSDESDAVVLVQAKKPRFTKKDNLAIEPSVITSSEITEIPRNEDFAHYLKVQKLLVSQLQVEEVKNQKLTEELKLSKLQTVNLLAKNEQMKIQLAAKESQSISSKESTSLLHRAQPSTLRQGEIIMIHSHFVIIK
jgi:hypothetical protein